MTLRDFRRTSLGERPKCRLKAEVADHLLRFGWRESLTIRWGDAG
jgi:hypothetical protein